MAEKFAQHQINFHADTFEAAQKLLAAHGFKPDASFNAVGSGLTWIQLVQLVFEFIGTYGPQTVQIIGDVAKAVATIKSNPSAAIATLQALAAKDGPQVLAIAQAIAGMLGVQLPMMPATLEAS